MTRFLQRKHPKLQLRTPAIR